MNNLMLLLLLRDKTAIANIEINQVLILTGCT